MSESGHSRGASASVQTIYDLAAVWYQNRMAEDWNPPTADETEAVFRGFGLTGDFWQFA